MRYMNVLAFVLAIAAGAAADDIASAERQWVWQFEPRPLSEGAEGVRVERIVVTTFEEETESTQRLDERGAMALSEGTLVISVKNPEGCEFRPVGFFDGGRVHFTYCGAVWHPAGMYHSWYHTDGGAVVKTIGLERRNLEGQKKAALRAREKLKERKEVLPYPELGKPYPLRLITDQGEVLDLSDFRGKVVVIDWWASWCNPCMAKMPWLMAMSSRFSDQEVVFVSVNFDDSRTKAVKQLQKLRQQDPVIGALSRLGVTLDAANVEGAVIEALEGRGVKLDHAEAREAVLGTLQSLGVDLSRVRSSDALGRLGLSWKLTVATGERKALYGQANGDISLPQFFLVDRNGVLQWHQSPTGCHEEIEAAINKLLNEGHLEHATTAPSTTSSRSAKRGG